MVTTTTGSTVTKRLFLLACAAAALSGCLHANVKPATPKAFAAEVDPDAGDDGTIFRAINPEGVAYRVRLQDNKPKGSALFWRDALKKHLTDAGYILVKTGKVKAGKHAGYYLDLLAPTAEGTFRFMVSVFTSGGDIILAEAAGDQTEFQGAEADVMKAIEAIRIN